MSSVKHKHSPCRCGCGELADECMKPASALNAFQVVTGRVGMYFEAPNGYGDPTLWRRTNREPVEILSKYQVPAEDWDRIVAAVTA